MENRALRFRPLYALITTPVPFIVGTGLALSDLPTR